MLIRCYFNQGKKDKKGNDIQCQKDALFDEYWCGEEHRRLWQEENYPGRKSRLDEFIKK